MELKIRVCPGIHSQRGKLVSEVLKTHTGHRRTFAAELPARFKAKGQERGLFRVYKPIT